MRGAYADLKGGTYAELKAAAARPMPEMYGIPCWDCGHVALLHEGPRPSPEDHVDSRRHRRLDGRPVKAVDVVRCPYCGAAWERFMWHPSRWVAVQVRRED